MAVGVLRRFVMDVNDLDEGERFWSAVSGFTVDFSAWTGQFSGLGDIETGSILLQLVPEKKTPTKNRAHLDFSVDDVGQAVEEVVALGGAVQGSRPIPDDDSAAGLGGHGRPLRQRVLPDPRPARLIPHAATEPDAARAVHGRRVGAEWGPGHTSSTRSDE